MAFPAIYFFVFYQQKGRFCCEITDLLGFSGNDANAERWGCSTDECVRRLERTVEAEGDGKPRTLVAHDGVGKSPFFADHA